MQTVDVNNVKNGKDDLRILKWNKFHIREKLTTIFFFSNSTLDLVWYLRTPDHIQLSHPKCKRGHLLLGAEDLSQEDRFLSCLGKLMSVF